MTQIPAEGRAAGFGMPDLPLGNYVLAHVSDINDFVSGMKALLPDHGAITMDVPHPSQLVGENQLDTVYHEHFVLPLVLSVEKVFAHRGCHADAITDPSNSAMESLRDEEICRGSTKAYGIFEAEVRRHQVQAAAVSDQYSQFWQGRCGLRARLCRKLETRGEPALEESPGQPYLASVLQSLLSCRHGAKGDG